MRGRTQKYNSIPVKQPEIKIHSPPAHPIEIGNGYGYFCNIDIDIVETPTNTSIHIDIHKDSYKDMDIDNSKKPFYNEPYNVCCCLPFILLGLSALFL
jgi:hypothetical protein